MKHTARAFVKSRPQPVTLFCEVLQGLKPFAQKELLTRFGKRITLFPQDDPEMIFLEYSGDLREMLHLRSVVAVYLLCYFPIPRPRALLGQQHYQALLQSIDTVRKLYPPQMLSGFRISASGENSAIFTMLREKISADIRLPYDPENGDLLLRVLPSRLYGQGWEVLTRLSPRPLSTRPWRVYNMQGALNATIATAMLELTQPRPQDRFLNMMCGSATLLIERLSSAPAALTVGCDINTDVLTGARENIKASKLTRPMLLLAADATRLPFLEESFDVICADLPWGHLVGSHEQNSVLYPGVFAEAARLARPGSRLALLTHEIQLFEQVLQDFSNVWALQEVVKVFQGGLHPRIYLFQRCR